MWHGTVEKGGREIWCPKFAKMFGCNVQLTAQEPDWAPGQHVSFRLRAQAERQENLEAYALTQCNPVLAKLIAPPPEERNTSAGDPHPLLASLLGKPAAKERGGDAGSWLLSSLMGPSSSSARGSLPSEEEELDGNADDFEGDEDGDFDDTVPASSSSTAPVDGRRYRGFIKVFNAAKGYGFIRSQEVFEKFKSDTFLHKSQMGEFNPGDKVTFTMRANKQEKPQATDLKPWTEADKAEDAAETAEKRKGREVVRPSFEGYVKRVETSVVDGKTAAKFAFIHSPEVFDLYGADVFVPGTCIASKHPELGVGDRVTFTFQESNRGTPQVIALTVLPQDDDEEDQTMQLMSGTIKSFDADKGYGFIACPEAQKAFGRDVFLHRRQVKNFKTGDNVIFRVKMNSSGNPQAYVLKTAPSTMGWLAAAAEEKEEEELYHGEVKSVNWTTGYGFIHCPVLNKRFQRDVFLHQSQFEGLRLGDRVVFKMQLKKGAPQALEVRLANMASPAVAAAAAAATAATAAADGTEEAKPLPASSEIERRGLEAVTALNKRLLRACQSARAESVEAVRQALAGGADANARDVTGMSALMISALNVRHAERKCRHLIEAGADLRAPATDGAESLTVLQWARERVNARFGSFLEAVERGETIDCPLQLDAPNEEY